MHQKNIDADPELALSLLTKEHRDLDDEVKSLQQMPPSADRDQDISQKKKEKLRLREQIAMLESRLSNETEDEVSQGDLTSGSEEGGDQSSKLESGGDLAQFVLEGDEVTPTLEMPVSELKTAAA